MRNPEFKPGINIAMKVPPHEYEQTVRFYKDVLGFEEIITPTQSSTPTKRFRFGDKILWVDRVDGMSQAEIWLEVETTDYQAAAEYLERIGVVRCDEIEELPERFKGFWIKNPGNIVHLVQQPGTD